MLAAADWVIVVAYLAFTLGVGFYVRGRAQESRASYFIAGRSLPWWWAGTSIAATTFAADTPLAITGIVASRGLSGNWLWLSWVLVHAGVVVLFARRWWRTGVVTDAEFIALRYSGRGAAWLRSFRAGLYGLVYNAIILGWVLRAMGKIAQPLFPWETWAPGLTAAVGRLMPDHAAIGGPADVLTIVALVTIVTLYSSLGGIRGVIRTDLVQFALGLVGSTWLAVAAWRAVGGRAGLRAGLVDHYGPEVTALVPSMSDGWPAALGLGALAFGAYLLVQSYANVPADGGGYVQQRLNATRSEGDAQKAAGLFLVLHYVVRVWPWLIVALAALVLVPVGGEMGTLRFGLDEMVARDREMAYPALMIELLPAGVFGLLVVSLLAAFMSTIDTHFNWGASYAVSDVLLRLKPDLSPRAQIVAARAAVIGFAVLAVVVAFQIDRIEQAWRWVAVLGAALGIPTVLRWFWWRTNAAGELAGAGAGLATAAGVSALSTMPYELQLIWISAASAVGVALGIALGPPTDRATLERFAARVGPLGFWPGRARSAAVRELARGAFATVGVALAALVALYGAKLVLVG